MAPPLSYAKTTALVRLARTNAVDLVRRTRLLHDPAHWQFVSMNGPISIFKSASSALSSWTFCASIQVAGTIDQASMCVREVPDSCLYTLATGTPTHPTQLMQVIWLVLPSFLGPLARPRDVCAVENQHEFQIDGKRGWLRVVKSVEIPIVCPSSPRYVRADLVQSGFVVTESKLPGFVQINYMVQLNPRGMLPPGLAALSVKRLCVYQLKAALLRLQSSQFLSPSYSHTSPVDCDGCFSLVDASRRRMCPHCYSQFASERKSSVVLDKVQVGVQNGAVQLGQLGSIQLMALATERATPWDLKLSDSTRAAGPLSRAAFDLEYVEQYSQNGK
ncbi:unnamed protein product [Aphanomyces euteiches]|uniref:START domain-containing protein n=1 Tax=Aphanomyces euteiches TaxID=100861 RepID=A0A6G0W961_9STRA|nr:hypothetical protein Ae201684_017477 [Aphanomyces euteiches]KAH9141475.1 hypothetical protein AeRB84_014347 [Aphanomyces euteiches]